MSWSVSAKGRRFAIDGELSRAANAAQLGTTIPQENLSLAISRAAVDALLQRAPHDCDIVIALSGNCDANGFGAIHLDVNIAPHVDRRDAGAAASEQAAVDEITGAATAAQTTFVTP